MTTDFTAEELFKAGNYGAVVKLNHPDAWQTFAAQGLIGLGQKALTGLAAFNGPEVDFYRAVIHWMEGETTEAKDILKALSDPHAQNLLELIKRPVIRVLSQLSWRRTGPQDLLTGIQPDPQFQVRNISHDPGDLTLNPQADITTYYRPHEPPDFFVCQKVEWHTLPQNLPDLPCPIFGESSDYDAHLQIIEPWLKIFDEMIASDPIEYRDIKKLVHPTPVSMYPKIFGVPDNLPPINPGHRPLDFFISGSITNPYWPEKSALLYPIATDPQLEKRMILGFLTTGSYHALLNATKVSVSSLRRPFMPTRALEALAMGCAVVLQKDSVLNLYVKGEMGTVPFDNTPAELTEKIRDVNENWELYRSQVEQGAKYIRREFNLQRVASQYFRFLTFLAAKPRIPRKKEFIAPPPKRLVIKSGWLPSEEACVSNRNITLQTLKAQLQDSPSVRTLIDFTRELVLLMASETPKGQRLPEQFHPILKTALAFYQKGLKGYPRSLVLRFNYLRVLFHLGTQQERDEVQQLGHAILNQPLDYWTIDPLEDIFPWDFFGRNFNYRRYLDALTQHAVNQATVEGELLNTIYASIHHYMGQCKPNIVDFEQAHALDPSFADYKLSLATERLGSPENQEKHKAVRMLEELIQGSVCYGEAYDLLETYQKQTGNPSEAFNALAQSMGEIQQNTINIARFDTCIENAIDRLIPEDFAPEPRGTLKPSSTPVTAILYARDSALSLERSLTLLMAQTLSEQLEIIVCDHPDSQSQAWVKEKTRSHKHIRWLPIPKNCSYAEALNRCVEEASHHYLTLVTPQLNLTYNALEVLATQLDTQPRWSLAYGNVGFYHDLSETQLHDPQYQAKPRLVETRQRPSRCCWPSFTPRGLFYQLGIEPTVMWKRSIHEELGSFDPLFDDAASYAFWIKMGLSHQLGHVREILGTYYQDPKNPPPWLAPFSPSALRAHEALWPKGWGSQPQKPRSPIIPESLARIESTAEITHLLQLNKISLEEAVHLTTQFQLAHELILEHEFTLADALAQGCIKTFPMADSPNALRQEIERFRKK
ncbi:MAG: glycosyltransferase [Myxococcota bacterium]|nr:glycosyltransferase [Myxococcota bacterium]